MSEVVVASIGATHPANVAGVGRDVVVGTELGVTVVTVITAVSAQDESGVHALHVLPAQMVQAQLESLRSFRLAAIRVGVLGSAQNVHGIAKWLRSLAPIPAVVDPVFAASAGGVLTDGEAIVALRDRLATLANVILTPNLIEAAILLGQERIALAEMEEAARRLQARGAFAVLLKGGHLDDDPVDMLATAESVEAFTAPRISTAMHGTGCTLAMALACGLAHRSTLRDAVRTARDYVRAKMTEC